MEGNIHMGSVLLKQVHKTNTNAQL